MGNFSRIDTFHPEKNYIGIRLQQGVPIVDADWNDLNDVIRYELYNGLNVLSPFDVLFGTDSFNISIVDSSTGSQDFKVSKGTAIIEGRPVKTWADIQYSTQPWCDPERAGDSVDVIPPLPIPDEGSSTTGMAYLDVWEREVNSSEDSSILHPGIPTETCVRLKREVAIRVTDSNCTIPQDNNGHFFRELAKLEWTRGTNNGELCIKNLKIVEDRRTFRQTFTHERTIPPLFFEADYKETWKFNVNGYATSNENKNTCGFIPILLPDRSIIQKLYIRGEISGDNPKLDISLARYKVSKKVFFSDEREELLSYSFQGPRYNLKFDTELFYEQGDQKNIIDNRNFYYCLFADSQDKTWALISHISITYNYILRSQLNDGNGTSYNGT